MGQDESDEELGEQELGRVVGGSGEPLIVVPEIADAAGGVATAPALAMGELYDPEAQPPSSLE